VSQVPQLPSRELPVDLIDLIQDCPHFVRENRWIEIHWGLNWTGSIALVFVPQGNDYGAVFPRFDWIIEQRLVKNGESKSLRIIAELLELEVALSLLEIKQGKTGLWLK